MRISDWSSDVCSSDLVRVTRAEMEADRAAHLRLALALEQLQPQSSGALSALLSTAVLRLVRQIAGEVEVDAPLLEKRCLAIAACIEAQVGQIGRASRRESACPSA